MASPTQMVVGKGIPNLLIAKGLVKILKELTSQSHQNLLPIFFHGIVGLQKIVFIFLAK